MEYKVIKPSGVLDDLTSSQMRHGINSMLADGTDTILLDLQQVTFINSSGIDALRQTRKTVDAKGANLFVCSLNDPIRIIFELARMDDLFKIFSDRQDFEQSIAIAG